MQQTPLSLYERIGGKAAVNAAVDIFYDKVFADPLLKPFFEGIDQPAQRNKQKVFLTYAFGGIPTYTGKNMREAHKHLVEEKGLSEEHFNRVAEHLQNTLVELEVPEDMISEVMTIAASTHDDVLNL